MERGDIDFDYAQNTAPQLIKIVGVGGGGGNAVNKMFTLGTVPGVSFLQCNTDAQALHKSPIRDQIVLGPNVTKGLGAGNRPLRAREAAEESAEEIRKALTAGSTQMVFITAGMGGGTGTGAAPVIGRVAMEEGLLTIGIVTIPFVFEGRPKILQAFQGVNEIRKHVDALLIINNQRLIDIYADFTLPNAFAKADETLSNAARGISDIVNLTGVVNCDFADVDTTLRGGGVVIINTGRGTGPDRISMAIKDALNSPLIKDNDITQAKHLLLVIYTPSESESPVTALEMRDVEDFTSNLSQQVNTIWGLYEREGLGDAVEVTILASGFEFKEDTVQLIRQGKSQVDEEEIERGNKQIKEVYGSSIENMRRIDPVTLSISELDDEELIAILTETPSIKRDKTYFEKIRAQRSRHIRIEAQHHSQRPATEPFVLTKPRALTPREEVIRRPEPTPEPKPQVVAPEPEPQSEAAEQQFVIHFND